VVFSVKKLKIVLSSANFKSRVVEQHDKSLLSVIWCKVNFISFNDSLFISVRSDVLKLHNLAKVDIIVIAATLVKHFLSGFH